MERLLLLAALLGIALAQTCDPKKCSGNCRCIGADNPANMSANVIPQLVMLTFDDAVGGLNYPLYKDLFLAKKTNPSGCNIGATFFISHDYNNYAFTHQLWAAGNEIAVHTVTHETNIDMWRTATAERWRREAVGMRDLIVEHALIPVSHIKGFRAPFLQTSGDPLFQMLKKEGFMYDSSFSTRSSAGLKDRTMPIWPFTLDYRFRMDCIITPCPKETHAGIWEVPLISLFKMRRMIDGKDPEMMPCAMADACLPFPMTEQETYDYFKLNFDRHYKKNKAPFPLFLHEAWLREPGRKAGYIKFFNYLMSTPDVFIVPVQEVIEFMKKPKTLSQYKETRCVRDSEAHECSEEGTYCYYDDTKIGGSRSFYICDPWCPDEFPWLL